MSRATTQGSRATSAEDDIPGFEREAFTRDVNLTFDVLQKAMSLKQLVERQGVDLPYRDALLAELTARIEGATGAAASAQVARNTLQEKQREVRELTVRFNTELVKLRRTVRAALGSSHFDDQRLRATSGRRRNLRCPARSAAGNFAEDVLWPTSAPAKLAARALALVEATPEYAEEQTYYEVEKKATDPSVLLHIWYQRFGSAANLNLHFHMLALDGVYGTTAEQRALPRFDSCEEGLDGIDAPSDDFLEQPVTSAQGDSSLIPSTASRNRWLSSPIVSIA